MLTHAQKVQGFKEWREENLRLFMYTDMMLSGQSLNGRGCDLIPEVEYEKPRGLE